jgi:hypothetical protein
MTPAERSGIEALLADGTVRDYATRVWLKRQLEHADWNARVERMGGGKAARDARMKPLFDARCAVTALDMHAQLTDDGRKRGLWLWLLDESKACADNYDRWVADALEWFCKRGGVDEKTSEKFRLSSAMDEFKWVARVAVQEAALLEWSDVRELHAALGKALVEHASRKD